MFFFINLINLNIHKNNLNFLNKYSIKVENNYEVEK